MLNVIRTEPLTESEERLTAEWEFVGLFLRARPIFYVFTVTLVKRKNANQSIQNVQNLGSERR